MDGGDNLGVDSGFLYRNRFRFLFFARGYQEQRPPISSRCVKDIVLDRLTVAVAVLG